MTINICLPVRNEAKILETNANKIIKYCEEILKNYSWSITIVNNGSRDNTLEICELLQRQNPDIIKIKNSDLAGKGAAIKYGWKDEPADILIYMDIDLAVDLKDVSKLIKAITEENYDLVIGSRMLAESIIDRPWLRELASQSYGLLSRLILNHHFSDTQCGFKAMTNKTFSDAAPFIRANKWFFDTELITFAKRFKHSIKEIPVNWRENIYEGRSSKIRVFKDSISFFANLVALKIRLIRLKK